MTDSVKCTVQASSESGKNLKLLGYQLTQKYGFLGVPADTFEEAGRSQFITLLGQGLKPHSKVLEIGCGVLRVGYWLIHFLDKGAYCGIEPAHDRVEIGKKHLLSPEILNYKRPEFSFNEDFDTSVFHNKFDYFLAGSIWTHCSKNHIQIMLDGFVKNSSESGVFLTSYLPTRSRQADYSEQEWVGTSHESEVSGCVKHSRKWIANECAKRNLILQDLPGPAFDSQFWLRISKMKQVKSNKNYLKKKARYWIRRLEMVYHKL